MTGDLVAVSDAAAALAAKRGTIHAWLNRGRLTDHGKDDRGRRLVDLDEVKARLALDCVIPLDDAARTLFDAAAIAAQLGLQPSLIQSWHANGKIVARGNRGRSLLYDLDEVRAHCDAPSQQGRRHDLGEIRKPSTAKRTRRRPPGAGHRTQPLPDPRPRAALPKMHSAEYERLTTRARITAADAKSGAPTALQVCAAFHPELGLHVRLGRRALSADQAVKLINELRYALVAVNCPPTR